MTCRLAHDEAAYLLGALDPPERLAFEEHLPGCPACSAAVRELAGLPGLLSRVDAEVLQSPVAPEPLPETTLPALVRSVRRTRRRRTGLAVALAAAAVAAVAGTVAVTGLPGGADVVPVPAAAPAAHGRRLSPVASVDMEATVALRPVAWGTRLDLRCSYPEGTGYRSPSAYRLVVRTRDGRTEQVASWRSVPGRSMRLSAATAARRGEITAVEVRTDDGRPVLRLDG